MVLLGPAALPGPLLTGLALSRQTGICRTDRGAALGGRPAACGQLQAACASQPDRRRNSTVRPSGGYHGTADVAIRCKEHVAELASEQMQVVLVLFDRYQHVGDARRQVARLDALDSSALTAREPPLA